MIHVVSTENRQQVVLLFPIYLNKELFLLHCFSSFFFNLDTGSDFLVVVALTFDLIVSRLSGVQAESMGDGSS